MISKDGKTGLIVAGITGGESGAQMHAKTLTEGLHDFDGVTVKAGGEVMGSVQLIDQTKDLLVMEAISLPLSFIVLTWVLDYWRRRCRWRSGYLRSWARWQ